MARELLARFRAGEHDILVAPLQVFQLRAGTDHDLGAGKIEIEEGLDILLHRNAPDIDEDRAFQALVDALAVLMPAGGVELFGVHAARPGRDVVEAALGQVVTHGRGGDHQPVSRIVEPAHVPVARRKRNEREARVHVFGKPCVVAGREGQLPVQANLARRFTQTAFGRDVDRFRLEGLEARLNVLAGAEGHLDVGIGGQRDRPVAEPRMDDLDLVAHLPAFLGDARQCAHDPVDLRFPGIGHQHDAQWRAVFHERLPRTNKRAWPLNAILRSREVRTQQTSLAVP